MSMTLISTITVGAGGAASIAFASIPQTGSDILLLVSARDTSSGNSNVGLSINSNTANFNNRSLFGSGSSVASNNRTDNYFEDTSNYGLTTSNTFSNASFYFPNYAGSTNKTISVDSVNENNATAAYQTIKAGLWANTSAISSLTLLAGGTSFAQNTTASLYIITKGSGGATVS